MPKLTFQKINKVWGPLKIDVFAIRYAAQLPTFWSCYPDSRAISGRYLSIKIAQEDAVFKSTVKTDSQSITQTQTEQSSEDDVNHPLMDNPMLVPHFTENHTAGEAHFVQEQEMDNGRRAIIGKYRESQKNIANNNFLKKRHLETQHTRTTIMDGRNGQSSANKPPPEVDAEEYSI
ncbi:hypothetical protein CU098_010188 [Rhizopus stolonifer]|uniref:Uncharacterized protein n=1 Tax=Rhizopus stolonifer TaxID=4846 RepID=A0A367KPH1_RHIST|nr:hypothetical protein CU098_010188 [Rhizopus stolonifer]